MANTYTQLYVHLVFAVKYRIGIIMPEWKNRLFQYITALLDKRGHRMYAINGMPDHIHILVSINPVQSISDMVGEIKRASSKWINENHFVRGKFEWQDGYGAFSYSKSQVDDVVRYIQNQETHHHKRTFREEYLEFLKLFDITFDEKYIFKELQ